MQDIAGQVELDTMIQMLHWEDCQIQNAFLLSPTHQTDKGTVAFNINPDVVMYVISTEPNPYLGLKLHFINVDTLKIPIGSELNPSAWYSPTDNEIKWSFSGDYQVFDIRCQWMYFNIMTQEDVNYHDQYVIENPFIAGGGRKKF